MVVSPGRAGLPGPVAAAAEALVVPVDEAVCEECEEEEEEDEEEVGEEAWEGGGEAEGAGERATVGAATVVLAEALGGVHGTSVGTTAVAVSVSVEPAAPAGTCPCIWSLDGEPRSPMLAIQQCDVPAPTMQLVV